MKKPTQPHKTAAIKVNIKHWKRFSALARKRGSTASGVVRTMVENFLDEEKEWKKTTSG